MRIFITGATGFVGSALCARLLAEGHALSASVRDPGRARSKLGPKVELYAADADDRTLCQALSKADAVINLAGESIIDRRWTAARRRVLWSSRVERTQALVRAVSGAEPRPRVLLSASAVGYYGDRGDELLTEESAVGEGFLAELCQAWEQAALDASSPDVRVVLLRIGIVLGPGGGALAAMMPAFRLGLGGPLGSGRQYLPFIHLDDLIGILVRGLDDTRMHGPINATAPVPVTSRELAQKLGAALHRPAVLPVLAPLLQLALGERAQALLQGQRAIPARLEQLGHGFAYPTLSSALASFT